MGTISLALVLVLVCTINSVKPFTIRYDNGGNFTYSSHLGSYNYKLDLPDQQRQEQREKLFDPNEESSEYIVHGDYSFVLGGQLYAAYYTSDQDGYRVRIVNGKPMTSTGFGGTAQIPKDVPVTTKKPEPIIPAPCATSILGSRCGK